MSRPPGLEALDLPARRPDLPFLREVFRTFNQRIPFESASKIVRDRRLAAVDEKLRRPDVFWGEFRELGAGGTCFARTAALGELLGELGFTVCVLLGDIQSPRNHAALRVDLGGRQWLVDAGYPLPEIFELAPGEHETSVGTLRIERSPESWELLFVSGPEAGRRIVFELGPVSAQEFDAAWRRTFVRTSLFLSSVVLRREIDGRVMRFHAGEVQILDASSRCRIPLGVNRARTLSDAFDIDEDLLVRALECTGDPDPAAGATARIEVFREGEDSFELLDLLASPAGYARFVAGLGAVEIRATGEECFEARLSPPEGEPAVESIRYEPAARRLTIDRDFGLRRTGFQAESTDAGPRLVRFAELPDSREEFLRSDMGRSRIAAVLAMDLAALSRI